MIVLITTIILIVFQVGEVITANWILNQMNGAQNSYHNISIYVSWHQLNLNAVGMLVFLLMMQRSCAASECTSSSPRTHPA